MTGVTRPSVTFIAHAPLKECIGALFARNVAAIWLQLPSPGLHQGHGELLVDQLPCGQSQDTNGRQEEPGWLIRNLADRK